MSDGLKVLVMFWPLLLALVFLVAAKFFFEIMLPDLIKDWQTRRRFRKGESWRSDRDMLQWLRGMKPGEFEDYTAELFRNMGYEAEAVGKSHDGGIDVIAKKNGATNYIQCKKFISSTVPVGAVRDFYGALADRLANGKGFFITTNKFTLEAERFAEDKPIELIDGYKLIQYIRLTQKDAKSGAVQATDKVCPVDGGRLVHREGKYGPFQGCSNYPKCTYTTQ
ncbi:MAG: restriction endonuclease [Nanoarchaeota archaeon]